ncbi:hypothetical protein TOPH_08962 [Tolypocladium ophioglossoides CBS 100239]|uniref:Aminoglycoside phosphotransferase domain-containing protein n=1 Tax=Tolypocladium ophioglossoides (strain CBS 100239) TaxID=1163406 RepID=A0A0L0MXB0_TOLOC|nr:hypothetical protein TOPH_08962 [Tolypocladium ophioglossoides CBS 100239]
MSPQQPKTDGAKSIHPIGRAERPPRHDPSTLRIKAIIDWEFGGFWPEWFERPFWKRPGPSVALEGEEDDVQRCRDWLTTHCAEVIMPAP